MQTLPRKARVRDAVVPDDEDHVLLLVDYDTQELRVAAHLSRDPNMLAAFLEERDLHAETAALAFGPDYTKEQRNYSKNGMYSYAYGASASKFARTVGIPKAEGERIFLGLAEAYPGLPRMMKDVVDAVRERGADTGRGYVTLIDGRRLSVDTDRAYAGFNYLIQGSCATVLKQALVNLDAAGLGDYLRLPVHDEVVFSIPRTEVEDALPVIKECMERRDLRVPLTVSATTVERWGDPYR